MLNFSTWKKLKSLKERIDTLVKFGVLAIGEGGSSIGEYAAQKGFSVLAINTALIDFEKLKTVRPDSRIHLEGWEGAGRNREVGREAILTHSEKIYEKAKVVFKDCDMIYIAATTSGGTGSGGMSVGIEILSELNKRIGVITTLPEFSEGPKAHMNALECFSELSQIEQLGSVFSIDNERAKSIFKDGDKSKVLQLSNCQVIDHLVEVASLCSQPSYISNFDKNDFLGLLEERGSSVITKIHVPVKELKQASDIVTAIHQSIEQICAPRITSSQIVKAAVIGKIPREMMSIVEPKSIFQSIGTPYDIVEAYYSNKEHQNHCIFYTVMSGLSFPFERLKEIEEGVKNLEQELIDKVENSRSQKFETGNWSSKFKKKPESQTKMSLSERLSKFK